MCKNPYFGQLVKIWVFAQYLIYWVFEWWRRRESNPRISKFYKLFQCDVLRCQKYHPILYEMSTLWKLFSSLLKKIYIYNYQNVQLYTLDWYLEDLWLAHSLYSQVCGSPPFHKRTYWWISGLPSDKSTTFSKGMLEVDPIDWTAWRIG